MDNFGPYNPHSATHTGTNGMTPEQIAKLGQKTYEENQKKLAEGLKLTADEDGKYSVMGIEVPKTIAPVINVMLDTMITPISGIIADTVFHQTKNLSKNFNVPHDVAHKNALVAEVVARWGIIFAVPISKFVSANAQYGQELMQIRGELKSACESTGANYSHNKVVNGALKDASDRYSEKLALILPSLLSLIPQVMWGMQMQKETKLKRQNEFLGTNPLDGKIEDKIKKHLEKYTSAYSTKMEEIKLHDEEFKKFAASDNARKLYKTLEEEADKGNYMSGMTGGKKSNKSPRRNKEDILRKWFDDNIWADIKADIKADQQAAREALHKNGKPEEKASDNTLINQLFIAAPALSAAGIGIQSNMAESQKKGKKLTAYKLILKLKEEMQGKQSQEFVQEKLLEIFQKVEDELGGGSKHFTGGLLETLKESIKPLSEAIAEEKIDALALIKFAGEDLIIEHKNGSKRFRTHDEIQKSINDMCCTQLVKDAEVSESEFLGRFSHDHAVVKDSIKKTLAEMKDGEEKDLLISVLPAEVLEHAGLQRDDIRDARKRAFAQGKLVEKVGGIIIHIASLDEELLKKHGVSSKEIETIKQLNEQILSNDMETLKQLVESKDPIISALAAESLNEQLAGDKKVWSNIVKAKPLEERIAEIKAKKEEAEPAMEEGAHPQKSHHSMIHKDDKPHSHVDRHERSKAANPPTELGV